MSIADDLMKEVEQLMKENKEDNEPFAVELQELLFKYTKLGYCKSHMVADLQCASFALCSSMVQVVAVPVEKDMH